MYHMPMPVHLACWLVCTCAVLCSKGDRHEIQQEVYTDMCCKSQVHLHNKLGSLPCLFEAHVSMLLQASQQAT